MEIKFKPRLAKEITTTLIFGIPFLLLIAAGIIAVDLIEQLPNELNLILILLLLSILFSFMYSFGKVKNTSYKINDNFITRKVRFISELQEDVPVKQVTNIDYSIGWFFDKIFKTGTISVYTAGSSTADIIITDIKNVAKIYDDINSILHLKKSAKINDDGELVTSSKSELIKRVKPDAKLALIQNTILPFVFGFVLSFGMITLLAPIFLISGIIVYKTYKKRYYDFYTDKLEYYDGFFTYNKKTVPTERITNISENQTLIDRMFGTHTINIHTAGSSGAEIAITLIKDGDEIAKELKEELKKNGRN